VSVNRWASKAHPVMVNDAAQTDCAATPTIYLRRPTSDRVAKTSPAGLQSFGFISDDLSEYMTDFCPANNQFVRVTRRTKRQGEKANSPVVQVVQLESPLERLSDCCTMPYLRFFLVRSEEAGGSSPLSSTIFSRSMSVGNLLPVSHENEGSPVVGLSIVGL
jgi:hypothetical protein